MDTIKNWIKWFLMIGGMLFWFFVAVGIASTPEPREQRIDCSVAEFHPDYPPDVKDACRRMRNVVNT